MLTIVVAFHKKTDGFFFKTPGHTDLLDLTMGNCDLDGTMGNCESDVTMGNCESDGSNFRTEMKDNSKVFIYDQGHFTCVKSHRQQYRQRETGGDRERERKRNKDKERSIDLDRDKRKMD